MTQTYTIHMTFEGSNGAIFKHEPKVFDDEYIYELTIRALTEDGKRRIVERTENTVHIHEPYHY